MKKEKIAILMATYNGEKYLMEQIDSLFAQTSQDWHLYVHDDGSQDGTIAILKNYAEKNPQKITLMDYPSQGGACKNFMSMLERVDAQYYMFCDQDDVWMQEKIEMEYDRIKEYEKNIHMPKPIVVFTDLSVVDSNLHLISKSFFQYSCIYPEFLSSSFERLGAANMVTGCTMLFNKMAKDCIIYPVTPATMHDTWISLCVKKSGGTLINITSPSVYYRQHNDNTLGAKNMRNINLKYRLHFYKEIYKKNKEHFFMLKALGYGSVFKFLFYKTYYKIYKVLGRADI